MADENRENEMRQAEEVTRELTEKEKEAGVKVLNQLRKNVVAKKEVEGLREEASKKPKFYDVVGKAQKAEAEKPESKAFKDFAMGFMDGKVGTRPYLQAADQKAFKQMYNDVKGDKDKVNQWVAKVAEYRSSQAEGQEMPAANLHRMASAYVKAYDMTMTTPGFVGKENFAAQVADGYVDVVVGKIKGRISDGATLEEYLIRVSQNLFNRRSEQLVDLNTALEPAINAAYNGIEDEFSSKPLKGMEYVTGLSTAAAKHLDGQEKGLSSTLSAGYAKGAEAVVKGSMKLGKHLAGDIGAAAFGGTAALLAGTGSALLAATELGGHYGKEGAKVAAMGTAAAVAAPFVGAAAGAKYVYEHGPEIRKGIAAGATSAVKGAYRAAKGVAGGAAEGIAGLGAGSVWGMARIAVSGRHAFKDAASSISHLKEDALQWVADKIQDRSLGKNLSKNEKEVKSLMHDLDVLEIRLKKEMHDKENVTVLKNLDELKNLEKQYMAGKVQGSDGKKRVLTHGEKQAMLERMGELHQEVSIHIPDSLKEPFERKTKAFLAKTAEQFQIMSDIQKIHENRQISAEDKAQGRGDDKVVLQEKRDAEHNKLWDNIMGTYHRNVAQPINDHMFFLMPEVMQKMMPKYKQAAVERSDASMLAKVGNIAALSNIQGGVESTSQGREYAKQFEVISKEGAKKRIEEERDFMERNRGAGKGVIYKPGDEIEPQEMMTLNSNVSQELSDNPPREDMNSESVPVSKVKEIERAQVGKQNRGRDLSDSDIQLTQVVEGVRDRAQSFGSGLSSESSKGIELTERNLRAHNRQGESQVLASPENSQALQETGDQTRYRSNSQSSVSTVASNASTDHEMGSSSNSSTNQSPVTKERKRFGMPNIPDMGILKGLRSMVHGKGKEVETPSNTSGKVKQTGEQGHNHR